MDDLKRKLTVEDFLSPGTMDPARYYYGRAVRMKFTGDCLTEVERLSAPPGRVFRRGGASSRAGTLAEVERG